MTRRGHWRHRRRVEWQALGFWLAMGGTAALLGVAVGRTLLP